jgi:FMN reductase
MANIIGVSGNLAQPSRTENLVNTIISEASKRIHKPAELISVASLVDVLGNTVSYNQFPPKLTAAYEKVNQAELLVIGSPVFKASYTGLLKHFFDLIDPKALNEKVVILAATGGSDQHASILDYQLRTLASFFGLHTVPTAIYAKDSEFVDYELTSDSIRQRIARAVDQAAYLLSPAAPQVLVA